MKPATHIPMIQAPKKDGPENVLYRIDEVENGLACGCVCPKCKAPLEAKNNIYNKRAWHFAHAKGYTECGKGGETVLHIMAKEIIQKEEMIMLPNTGGDKPYGLVKLHDVEIEKFHPEYEFKPDAEGKLPDGRTLFIEIYVKGDSSLKKRKTIKDNNLLSIQIDVNGIDQEWDKLTKFLLEDTSKRKWLGMPTQQRSSSNIVIVQKKELDLGPLHTSTMIKSTPSPTSDDEKAAIEKYKKEHNDIPFYRMSSCIKCKNNIGLLAFRELLEKYKDIPEIETISREKFHNIIEGEFCYDGENNDFNFLGTHFKARDFRMEVALERISNHIRSARSDIKTGYFGCWNDGKEKFIFKGETFKPCFNFELE